jgi:hypothetical protein
MSVMPPVTNRETDVEIPNRAFSSWTEAGKPRQLRRPLTADERAALEDRRDELVPVVAPFLAGQQSDRVALALLDMYGAYTSMRGGEDEAAARVDAVLRLLEEWPAWAIIKACNAIRRNGVWRNGKFDRQWPPSEPELVDAVRKEAALYRDTYDRCVALLTATVEAA